MFHPPSPVIDSVRLTRGQQEWLHVFADASRRRLSMTQIAAEQFVTVSTVYHAHSRLLRAFSIPSGAKTSKSCRRRRATLLSEARALCVLPPTGLKKRIRPSK